MPWWVIAAGLASIAITALLTAVLWRLNAPLRERGAQREGAGAYGATPITAESRGRDLDAASDAGSDGAGGGDGGGD